MLRFRKLLRFSLRSLLLASILIGVGLGWYFRTQTIEQHWENGSLKARYTVRNSLSGGYLCAGKQVERLTDGNMTRTAQVQGVALEKLSETPVDWRYWQSDGTPAPPGSLYREWFQFVWEVTSYRKGHRLIRNAD